MPRSSASRSTTVQRGRSLAAPPMAHHGTIKPPDGPPSSPATHFARAAHAFCCTKTTPGTAQHAVSALDYTPSVQQPDRVQARPSCKTSCKTSRRFARRCTVRLTAGFYVGAVSGLPLFSSDAKFDSGAFVRSAVWVGLGWVGLGWVGCCRAASVASGAWLGMAWPQGDRLHAHEEWLTATATMQADTMQRTPCSGHHAADTMQQTLCSGYHAADSMQHAAERTQGVAGRPSLMR